MPKNRYLVTIGTFDGVHRGHQKLLSWVIARAKKLKLKTRVVFFVAPPRFFFKPEMTVPTLTASKDRRKFIRSLGIDRVEMLRFGPRWAAMPHTRFFADYIIGRWKAGGLLVGRDFAFGKGRKGGPDYLKAACAQHGLHLGILPLMRVDGRKISSSGIRGLLLKGHVKDAAKLLGRDYAVTGRVVRGQGLGRKIDVPTANLNLSRELLVPAGVFAVRVHGRALKRAMRAVCNVGFRPTLNGRLKHPKVEVHIPGWTGSLYGRRLTVEFLRRLRPERKFPSLEALRRAIQRDIAAAKA
ncbi:MAG: riboflavin biosynthesis protein RibF [Elusimicrobiota bacterium]